LRATAVQYQGLLRLIDDLGGAVRGLSNESSISFWKNQKYDVVVLLNSENWCESDKTWKIFWYSNNDTD